MAKVSPWLFLRHCAWVYATEKWGMETIIQLGRQGSKIYVYANLCRPSAGLLLEETMNYLDNFANFSCYLWSKWGLYLSSGWVLIYSPVLEILRWISSFPSGLLLFMFIGKTSLWLGDHAGLCSHQTPLQCCSPPDVWGWLPDQILLLTGAPDKHFSITNSSCCFKVLPF